MRDGARFERPRAWLSEPLVQFALVAAVLFGADRVRTRARGGPRDEAPAVRVSGAEGAVERHLVVDAEATARLVAGFERAENRAPSTDERRALVERWVGEELLFREALARKLDRGDDRVRQLLADKMRTVLEREALGAPPTDAEVRAAFDASPQRWARDEAFDFVQVFVHGDDAASQARAKQLLAELEQGADPARMGDVFSGGRRYRRRSLEDLRTTFGDAFVRGLPEQAPGTWALRSSRFGTHLVKVEGRSAAEAPAFEAVAEAIRHELAEERKAAALAARQKELRARWTVVEPAP